MIPTSIISGTPLDCTFCSNVGVLCGLHEKFNSTLTDPGYNAWWVKKFCTFEVVDEFLLYFPHVLLFMALILMLIERVFDKIFKSGLELQTFYHFLVTQGILTGEKGDKETKDDPNDNTYAIELAQGIGKSSNYFSSYVTRTVFEFLVWFSHLYYPFLTLFKGVF